MKYTTSVVFSAGVVSALLFGFVSDRLVRMKGNSFARKYIGLFLFGLMVFAILLSILAKNHILITWCFATADFCLVSIVLNCFSVCVDIGGDRVSTLTGMLNFCGQAGAFLMSIVFGKLVDLTQNFETPQFVMLGLLVGGGMCWTAVDSSKKIIMEADFNTKPLLA
jgi:sugar phosphate permease